MCAKHFVHTRKFSGTNNKSIRERRNKVKSLAGAAEVAAAAAPAVDAAAAGSSSDAGRGGVSLLTTTNREGIWLQKASQMLCHNKML